MTVFFRTVCSFFAPQVDLRRLHKDALGGNLQSLAGDGFDAGKYPSMTCQKTYKPLIAMHVRLLFFVRSYC